MEENQQFRGKKSNRNITLIFYTTYVVLTLALVAAMFWGQARLTEHLAGYERSRPMIRAQEVFQEYFAQPDWLHLYAAAGLQDTPYEDADDFAIYMEARTAGSGLSFTEVPGEDDGIHKYLWQAGDDTLGYFTLVNIARENAPFPKWEPQDVVLYRDFPVNVTLSMLDSHQTWVNGVALDETYTLRVDRSAAEALLPQNILVPRTCTVRVNGFMNQPQITVLDESGRELELVLDEKEGVFRAVSPLTTLDSETRTLALETARIYALRMIDAAGSNQVGEYFDPDSDFFRELVSATPWLQSSRYSGYSFDQPEIFDYLRCSEDWFTIRVRLPFYVIFSDGSQKEYLVDSLLLFQYLDGRWQCVGMENADALQSSSHVRLSFLLGEDLIFTNLFPEETMTFTAPLVTVPEGMTFVGWGRMDGPQGELTLVFTPSADGTVTLPEGALLEPMTLYAMFEPEFKGGNT